MMLPVTMSYVISLRQQLMSKLIQQKPNKQLIMFLVIKVLWNQLILILKVLPMNFWCNGRMNPRPMFLLKFILIYNQITLKVYARKNDILKTPGWKQLKSVATQETILCPIKKPQA